LSGEGFGLVGAVKDLIPRYLMGKTLPEERPPFRSCGEIAFSEKLGF
jgi:hypothetical protein